MSSVDHPQGWTELWKLGQESFQNYNECMQSLPSCVHVRNDPRQCRLHHLSRGEEDLFLDKGHCMRSIEMKRVSSECGLGGGISPRRYKILVCEQSVLAIII
ncbi:hypothetical protein PHMEG_00017349 [Phytophthora megakarya]|uniref:Uncharacterized protein n=1 Tax=Phytophthora megakarya TaxID=4795 RepID=A0A225VYA2_9STRA|nr:hypothetical protein PHMEG_00017349 [Phytophthora megakarya]